MSIELLKVVKEDVNYLVYFSNVRYGLFIVLLVVLIGTPIVYSYSVNTDLAFGFIFGMFWLSVVRLVGFSFRKNGT